MVRPTSCTARLATIIAGVLTLLLPSGGCPPGQLDPSGPEDLWGVSGAPGDSDAASPVYFELDVYEGPAPLTVRARASTLTGDPLPEVEYVWDFGGSEDAGAVDTHGERAYTFSKAGLYTVTLSLTLAGLPGPIACTHGPSKDSLEASVKVTEPPPSDNSGERSVEAGDSLALPLPGVLSVSPGDAFSSSGFVGGPFAPPSKDYTLENTGGQAIEWTASKTQDWVSLSKASGSLEPSESDTITVSINANADELPPGSYGDTVTFTNTTNGNGDAQRGVSLHVYGPTDPLQAPYSDQPVTVDGTIHAAEWSDANLYAYDATDVVPPGIVVYGDLAEPSDTSAIAYVKHDADYLYVAVAVTDDVLITEAPEVWEADVVELFLDHDNSDTEDIGLNRVQFDVNAGGQTAATPPVPPDSWAGAASVTAEGYSIEVRIEKADFGLTTGMYGFDIAISDIEPESGVIETRYWYFATSEAVTDESKWGDIILQAGPGELSVTPSTDFSSSGQEGGPFTPPSKTYTVENIGAEPVDWTASNTQDWISLSKTGGTLLPGESDTVTVSINENANDLPPESYSDSVDFANTTNHRGDTARPVNLTVNELTPGELSVDPTSGLASFGDQGGPFTPSSKIYTVENVGGEAITWTVSKTQAWVSLSKTGGTLQPSESDTVTVSINENANDLPARPEQPYADTVTFTNTTNHEGDTTRDVSLTVYEPGGEPHPMTTASRTSGVAPLAVFFEAAPPTSGVVQPTENTVGTLNYASQEYVWDFGDPNSGSWTTGRQKPDGTYPSRNEATGYTAAHVFENPGTYHVILSVLDAAEQTHPYYQDITVQEFSGTTYYVSSSEGDDDFDGLSPAAPFETLSRGVSSLGVGKRLLLKRADTFPVNQILFLPSGSTLGAYGSGASPIIQVTAEINPLFQTINQSDVRVMDVYIDGSSVVTTHAVGVWNTTDFLVLRVTFDGGKGWGNYYGDRLFIVDSIQTYSSLCSLYADCSRLVLLGNTFDWADNHNLYLSRIDLGGVISSNNIWKPTYLRQTGHCMRIAANHGPSWFVVVTDNDFDGYDTWLAVHLGLSSSPWTSDTHLDNLLFERNTLRNAGTLILQNGDYRNLTLCQNDFQGGFAFAINQQNLIEDDSGFDGPRGVWFHDNTITNDGGGWFSDTSPSSQHVYVYDNTVNGEHVPGNPPP